VSGKGGDESICKGMKCKCVGRMERSRGWLNGLVLLMYYGGGDNQLIVSGVKD